MYYEASSTACGKRIFRAAVGSAMSQKSNFQYDESFADQQHRFAMTLDMVEQRQKTHAVMNLQSGERIFEMGSGNGIMAREMAENVGARGHIIGADNSPAMNDLARNMCKAHPNVTFQDMDLDNPLPFTDNSFDVVTSSQCLCFLSDVDAVLTETYRVLKPGGRVVILDSDWGSLVWNCSNQQLMDKIVSIFTGIYTCAQLPRSLSRRLAEAGFDIARRDTHVVVNWNYGLDTYAGLQIEFVKSLAEKRNIISTPELQEWVNDLQEISILDKCFFSLNRYVFVAVKL
jgi:arsenite methyltransferase